MSQTSVAPPPSVAAIRPPLASSARRARLGQWRTDAPSFVVIAACAWWLLVAPRLFGGRGAGAVTGGAILTAVATVLVQPHRYVPRRAVWLALAVSAGAFVVALTAPTGWAGAGTAASYVCVSWTVVAVAGAVVRDRRVVNHVVLLIVAGVGVEMAESWLAWWGGGTAERPITGTFYWHNQLAVFLIAGTVIGFALWLQRSDLVAAFGLFVAMIGTIGIVYSTSRAALACFILAVAIVILTHLFAQRWNGLRRAVSALVVVGFGVWAVAGPPFFPHRSSPFAGTEARATGQSLGQNGGYRLDFWREALGVFGRHPLVGGGFHSMVAESVAHNSHHWPLTPFAHNGFIQPLTDGGLALGLPFLLASAGIAWLTVAGLIRSLRQRDFSIPGLVLPLCLGALLAHSAVDFDWSYAADFAVVAVIAGLVAGQRWSVPRPRGPGGSHRVTAVAAGAGWSGDMQELLPIAAAHSPAGHG